MRALLLGPPGSGKGTQGDLLAAHFGVPRVSTGDMLREAVASGSELGRRARERMDAGRLVPDEVVLGLVRERLARADAAKGFLLDGYPRNAAQAEALDGLLHEIGAELDAAVLIDVPQEEVVSRLGGRRVSLTSGATYHVVNNPPKVEGRCDVDGSELIQRDDDREEVVRERLRVYQEQTEPLIDYYRQHGILVEIDGRGTVRQVFDRVVEAL